jgi:hypothetical protein
MLHLLFYEQDAMQVVWHHLYGYRLDLGVPSWDIMEKVLYLFSQWIEAHSRLVTTAHDGVTPASQLPEQGSPPFGDQSNQVHASSLVVMVKATTQHRGFALPRECLMLFKSLPVHDVT